MNNKVKAKIKNNKVKKLKTPVKTKEQHVQSQN